MPIYESGDRVASLPTLSYIDFKSSKVYFRSRIKITLSGFLTVFKFSLLLVVHNQDRDWVWCVTMSHLQKLFKQFIVDIPDAEAQSEERSVVVRVVGSSNPGRFKPWLTNSTCYPPCMAPEWQIGSQAGLSLEEHHKVIDWIGRAREFGFWSIQTNDL